MQISNEKVVQWVDTSSIFATLKLAVWDAAGGIEQDFLHHKIDFSC